MVVVVMFGAFLAHAADARHDRHADASRVGRGVRRFVADRPVIPLAVLLVLLVLVLAAPCGPASSTSAGSPTPSSSRSRWRCSPACQTLTMLTGGIDLSVGIVASMAAFVMATQAPATARLVAILLALLPAALIGLANGIGVASSGCTR